MRRVGISVGGITVLCFVVGFFLLLPFYLGPDDLRRCEDIPLQTHLDDSCHASDAIVAVSGGDTNARTDEAIKLYKKGWAPRLLFSGAAQDKTGPSNAEAMKRRAINAGVAESSIITEEFSANTEENAKNTKDILTKNDLKRVILVTSSYHQRRASLEFRKRAGNHIMIINHPVAYDRQWTKEWFLTPSGLWLASSELVKVIGFYVNGR